jgi:hypothetical protein
MVFSVEEDLLWIQLFHWHTKCNTVNAIDLPNLEFFCLNYSQ